MGIGIGTILSLAKTSLQTIEAVRNVFPDTVENQLELAERYFRVAKTTENIRSGLQHLESALLSISRSKIQGPLYVFFIQNSRRVQKYNRLCNQISNLHKELGDDDSLCLYWHKKTIEIQELGDCHGVDLPCQ